MWDGKWLFSHGQIFSPAKKSFSILFLSKYELFSLGQIFLSATKNISSGQMNGELVFYTQKLVEYKVVLRNVSWLSKHLYSGLFWQLPHIGVFYSISTQLFLHPRFFATNFDFKLFTYLTKAAKMIKAITNEDDLSKNPIQFS